MGLINFLRGVFFRMVPIKDIQTALGVQPALSQTMTDRIDRWKKAYTGNAEWVDGDKIISLRIETSSVRELANVTLNEMTVTVTNDKLNKLLAKLKPRFNRALQRGLAMGAFIGKPLDENRVQFIAQDGFIVLAYDVEGRPCDVAFPDQKKVGNKIYTRLERHTLSDGSLTITNTAYVSDSERSLGRPVPLSAVEEWAKLTPSVTFPIDRNVFAYYVNPNDNTVDDSPAGVSAFDTALPKIRKADLQYGRLDNEFDSARRRIHADISLLKSNGGKYEIEDDIYVDTNGDKDDFFNEFSPALRQEGFIAGLEEYKREIEFDIGLSYGDLSQPQYVEKSATEVKASKYRKRDTVNHIQMQLEKFIDELVFSLAFYNRLTQSGYEVTCDFKDSILSDEESEREEDRKDLANNTLRPEEYRSRWRHETIEEAKANLPDAAEVD